MGEEPSVLLCPIAEQKVVNLTLLTYQLFRMNGHMIHQRRKDGERRGPWYMFLKLF